MARLLAKLLTVWTIPHNSLAMAVRDVIIRGRDFINASTGEKILLKGANVVMKGPPWIPEVAGDSVCDTTIASGSNTSCQTFNRADAKHLRNEGYNLLRLGVTWAGAQPNGPDVPLDEVWVTRLHALLDLASDHGLAVLLDVHQDAVGTAVCGEGVPMWFSRLATPAHIGKPLWPLPAQPDGRCGLTDTASWAEFAGDPDYNIKNRCCRLYNSGSWGALSGSVQAQSTMAFLFLNTTGRQLFANFTALLAEAVADKPAAIAIELMNEPPVAPEIERGAMYETWMAADAAIKACVPDMLVGIMDAEEAALPVGNLGLSQQVQSWLASSTSLFYAFHWYGHPSPVTSALDNALARSQLWDLPALLTEFGGYGGSYGCDTQRNATSHGLGSAYWHYSDYCWPKHCPNAEPDGHCPLPPGPRWGACITGWGSGNTSFVCD